MLNDIAIGLLGLVTLALFQSGRVKAASITGLLAQPFWLYTTYQAQQWGILFICGVYTFMYIKWALKNDEH